MSTAEDTGNTIAEVRRALGDEVAAGGERIISMLATIRKEVRESRVSHTEHRARLSAIEIENARSAAVREYSDGILKAWMERIDNKLDDVKEKVDYLDGETTGIHNLGQMKTRAPKESPGIQVTIAQKVLLGGGATAVGAALSWVLAHFG